VTEYLKPSFSVALGSQKYRDNWDAVFGKAAAQAIDLVHTFEADCECGCNLPQQMKAPNGD